MGEIVMGRIVGIAADGSLTIAASVPDFERFAKRRCEKVLVEIQDGRTISPEQRRKAHALIAEIADWSGDTPEWTKKHMKIEFMASRLQSIEKKIFSLSDCSVTTAREFVSHLVDFILRFDVPTRVPLYDLCEDTARYVYATLVNKKCAVCGIKGELHHEPALRMGADRTETPQLGWPAICLCREHHNQVHAHGNAFLTALHLEPVPIDVKIAKAHKFTKKAMRERGA